MWIRTCHKGFIPLQHGIGYSLVLFGLVVAAKGAATGHQSVGSGHRTEIRRKYAKMCGGDLLFGTQPCDRSHIGRQIVGKLARQHGIEQPHRLSRAARHGKNEGADPPCRGVVGLQHWLQHAFGPCPVARHRQAERVTPGGFGIGGHAIGDGIVILRTGLVAQEVVGKTAIGGEVGRPPAQSLRLGKQGQRQPGHAEPNHHRAPQSAQRRVARTDGFGAVEEAERDIVLAQPHRRASPFAHRCDIIGIARDPQGNLYVTRYDFAPAEEGVTKPGTISKISPEGKLLEEIATPAPELTGICISPEQDALFVTEASTNVVYRIPL